MIISKIAKIFCFLTLIGLVVLPTTDVRALPPDVTLDDLANATTPVCGRDLDSNGNIDLYELEWCKSTGLCPVDASQCVPNQSDPVCPPGSTYDIVANRCFVSAPTPTCPDSYVYDSILDRCRHDVVCPDGGVFNSSQDRCEKLLPDQCPAGYLFDSVNALCTLIIDCSGPFGTGVYDPVQDRCEMPNQWACPTGMTYMPTSGKCESVPYCVPPSLYSSNNDRCETSMSTTCPGGYSYDAATDLCLTTPSCPTPGILDKTADACVSNGVITCPPGTGYNASKQYCETQGTCPTGTTLYASLNQCFVHATTWSCPAGYSWNYQEHKCTTNPTCSTGYYDSSLKKCTIAYDGSLSSCPAGFVSNGARCYAYATCPPGTAFSSVSGTCTTNPTCTQPGYNWKASFNACYKYASCDNGSLQTVDDICVSALGQGCNLPYTFTFPSICMDNPDCPVGSSWNTTIGTCLSTATAQCDAGYIYNTYTHSCLHNPDCPTGSFNMLTQECDYSIETQGTGVCPSGYSPYTSATCSAIPTTAPGYSSDSIRGTDYLNASFSCSSMYGAGWTFDVTLGKCIIAPSCALGDWFVGGSSDYCQHYADLTCPAGWNLIGNWCHKAPSCSGSGSYSETYQDCISSAVTTTCTGAPDYSYSTTMSLCIATPTCPGGILNGNTCETPATLDSCLNPELGYTFVSGTNRCETAPVCNLGGVFSSADNACVLAMPGSGVCPDGFIEDTTINACLSTAGMCPSGNLDPATHVCYQAILSPCPSGYSQSGSTCYMSPSCPSGGAFSSANSYCVSSTNNTCDDPGYTYNPSYGFCMMQEDCSGGSLINSTPDYCRRSRSYTCATPYQLAGSNCWVDVQCGASEYFDSLIDKCVNTGDPCLPGDTLWNYPSYPRCIRQKDCPPGGSWDNTAHRCLAHLETTCPVGMSLTGSLCTGPISTCMTSAPFLPATFNPVLLQCEHEPIWACTVAGSTLDLTTGYPYYCHSDMTCLPPGVMTTSPPIRCEYPPATCPSGYTDTGTRCEKPVTCPDGGVYDTTLNLCVVPPNPCPAGTAMDPISHLCESQPTCTPPAELYTPWGQCTFVHSGQCVPPSAPDTTNTRCETPVECYQSGTWDSSIDHCTKPETAVCPDIGIPLTWDPISLGCVTAINCPPGTVWDSATNVCTVQPTITCDAGYTPDPTNGDCRISPPTCPVGGSYNPVTDICDAGATHTCGVIGFIPDAANGVCYKDPDCSGGVLDGAAEMCYANPTIDCGGWTWDATDSVCIDGPICGVDGTFNSALNQCEAAVDLGCPVGYVPDTVLGICRKAVVCEEAGAVFVAANDRCEMNPIADCPIPYLPDATSSSCEAVPICSQGTFSPTLNWCIESSTPTCDAGFTFDMSTSMCQGDPTCPVNMAYNPSTNQCEGDSIKNCPAPDYIYDVASDRCLYVYNCPDGGTVNLATDRCEKTYVATCPTGWTFDPIQSLCWIDVACTESGAVFNPTNNRCELSPTPVCETSYAVEPDGVTCSANFLCPPGATAYSGALNKCTVPDTLACLASTYSENIGRGRCEDTNVQCPAGDYMGGSNLCVGNAIHTCPLGYSYDSALDKCYKDPALDCPGGGTLNPASGRDQCEKNSVATCTETGYLIEGNICYKDIACAPGILNPSLQACEVTPSYSCPTGFNPTTDNSLCEKLQDCAPNSYTSSLQKCYYTAAIDCGGGGYTFNSATDNCEKPPPCPGGFYDSASNRCIVCPAGTSYNATSGKCETNAPVCGAGETFDNSFLQCTSITTSQPLTITFSGTAYGDVNTDDLAVTSSNTFTTRSTYDNYSTPITVSGTTLYQTGSMAGHTANNCGDGHYFQILPGSATVDGAFCNYSDNSTGNQQRYCVNFANGQFISSFSVKYCMYGTQTSATFNCPFYSVVRSELNSISGSGNVLTFTFAEGCWHQQVELEPSGWISGYPVASSKTVTLQTRDPCLSGDSFNGTMCEHTNISATNCPAGTTPYADGSECWADPTISVPDCASSGGTLGSGICYKSALRVCDTANGWNFDTTFGYCTRTPQCIGGSWNSGTGTCQAAITPNCPVSGGWSFDATDSKCYRSLGCGSGVFNPVNQRCEMTVTPDCGTYSFDTGLGLCTTPVPCAAESGWPGTAPTYSAGFDACLTDPVHECPTGLSYVGSDLCNGTPGCASSGTLDTTNDVCFLPYNHVCDTATGWVYDPVGGLCTIDPTCPGSGIPDFATLDKCVTTATQDCGSYTYDTTDAICVGPTTCAGGLGTYDAVDHRCEIANGQNCGTYTFDPGSNVCYEDITCSTDPSWVLSQGFWMPTLDQCGAMPERVCADPATQTYNAPTDQCFGNAGCLQPTDTLDLSIDKCVRGPNATCTPPMTYDATSGECYLDPLCPSGGVYDSVSKLCKLPIGSECGAVYTYDAIAGVCYGPPVCNGGVYDPTIGECNASMTNVCEPNYTWDDPLQRCLAPPGCPTDPNTPTSASIIYSNILKICTSDSGIECPPGMTWTGVPDLQCISDPTCPGTYIMNYAHDKCEGATNCPWGSTYSCLADPDQMGTDTNCSRGKYNAVTNKCEGYAVAPVSANIFSANWYDLTSDATTQTLTTTYYTAPLGPNPLYGDGSSLSFSEVNGAIAIAGHAWESMRWEAKPTADGAGIDWYDNTVTPSVLLGTTTFTLATTPSPAITIAGSADLPGFLHVRGLGDSLVFATDTVDVGSIKFTATWFADDPIVFDKTYCSPNPCVDPSDALLVVDTDADRTAYQNDGPVDANGCLGQLLIFNGTAQECLKPGWKTLWLNCCDTNESTWMFGMLKERCPPESKIAVDAKIAGTAHYVGTYCKKKIFGLGCVQKAEVYCTFGSKLARIIHEQGRPQLSTFAGTQSCSPSTTGLKCDWGSAEQPLCDGFAPEDFAALDFGQIDLSEYLGDIATQINGVDVQQRMQDSLNNRLANP